MGRSARRREAQGRLFWLWLLTLPILLMAAAAAGFGAPWPTPLTQRLAMVALAFPVLFMVGDPLFRDASQAVAERRPGPAPVVAAVALTAYLSGIAAIFVPAPPIAGAAAIVVTTYFTVRYLFGRY